MVDTIATGPIGTEASSPAWLNPSQAAYANINLEIEYEWDEGEPTEERAVEQAVEKDSPGDRTPLPARSGPIVRSEITYTDNEGNVIKIVHTYPPDEAVKDEVSVDGGDWAIVLAKAGNPSVGDDFADSFWGEVAEVRRDSGRPVKK